MTNVNNEIVEEKDGSVVVLSGNRNDENANVDQIEIIEINDISVDTIVPVTLISNEEAFQGKCI
jgi:hypothetical protein